MSLVCQLYCTYYTGLLTEVFRSDASDFFLKLSVVSVEMGRETLHGDLICTYTLPEYISDMSTTVYAL